MIGARTNSAGAQRRKQARKTGHGLSCAKVVRWETGNEASPTGAEEGRHAGKCSSLRVPRGWGGIAQPGGGLEGVSVLSVWPGAMPRLLWVYFCCNLQQGFCEMGDSVGVGDVGQISQHDRTVSM